MKFTTRVAASLAGLLCACALTARAGTEAGQPAGGFLVRTWGKAQGLPDDSVTAVMQARDGCLWVGTSAGVVRFDGVRFSPLPAAAPLTNALPRVTALCEDSAGRVWIGTQADGLWCWDKGNVTRHRAGAGLLDDSVTSLAADASGAVWIGLRSGLCRWTGQEFDAFTRKEGLPDVPVSSVHVARSGAVWVTTRGGMCRVVAGRIEPFALETDSQGRSPEFLGAYEDRRSNLWAFGDTYLINLTEGKRFNYFRGAEPSSVRLWSLCEGGDGRLWIGTSGRGLFCFDAHKFQPVTLNEPRWPQDVRAICQDREGNLWLGTAGKGLTQLRPQALQALRVEEGLPPGPANCLAFDSSGQVWAAMQTGGLHVRRSGRFENFAGTPGLITSLAVANDGTVWAATHGDGLWAFRNGRAMRLSTDHGLADDTLLAVCTETNGAVWAGTRSGSLHCITHTDSATPAIATEAAGSPVTALLAARTGGVFAGTESGLLLRGGNGRFAIVHKAAPLSGHALRALHEDARQRLWVGSDGGGLACLTAGSVVLWSRTNGLPDNSVLGLGEDAEGALWIVTGRGISRVSSSMIEEALAARGPLTCKLMLPAPQPAPGDRAPGWPRVARGRDGGVWFAIADGVLAASGFTGERDPAPPPVCIEAVLLNGEILTPGAEPPRLPVDLRGLEIQFTAYSFANPERVRFRHKLEGFDSDWVDSGDERRVRYGHLPEGDYAFRVNVRTADSVWSAQEARFGFTVPTPLWRAPWTLALYGLTTVAGITGLVRWVSHRRLARHLARLEQQQVMERERMRIAQDMHDDIGSKLTKLSFLSERVRSEVPSTGPVAVKLASIAQTSRELLQALDEIVWAVNPRNDTLEHLAAYLAQCAGEYFQNTAIECELRLPRELPAHALSAETRHNLFLAFEEVLSNALKHSEAKRVRIEMRVEPRAFEIRVADDGRGFLVPAGGAPGAAGSPPNSGNGLGNLRQRLDDVGGTCVIRSAPGAGATVTLRIPLPGTTLRQP